MITEIKRKRENAHAYVDRRMAYDTSQNKRLARKEYDSQTKNSAPLTDKQNGPFGGTTVIPLFRRFESVTPSH